MTPKRKSEAKADRINQILRNQVGIMMHLRLRCGDNFIGRLDDSTFTALIDESVKFIPKVREVKR